MTQLKSASLIGRCKGFFLVLNIRDAHKHILSFFLLLLLLFLLLLLLHLLDCHISL